MKITLFGASGMVGSRILDEALLRGHVVTAVARDLTKVPRRDSHLRVESGDVTQPADVRRLIAGADVVASAFKPPHGDESQLIDVARVLIDACRNADPRPRLIVVGGAATLGTTPGQRLLDSPSFPDAWRPVATAAAEAYRTVYLTTADVDWTVFAPAAVIEPGERTGAFRVGADRLIATPEGHSRITAEDFAVAFLDEVERPQFVRRLMTAAY